MDLEKELHVQTFKPSSNKPNYYESHVPLLNFKIIHDNDDYHSLHKPELQTYLWLLRQKYTYAQLPKAAASTGGNKDALVARIKKIMEQYYNDLEGDAETGSESEGTSGEPSEGNEGVGNDDDEHGSDED